MINIKAFMDKMFWGPYVALVLGLSLKSAFDGDKLVRIAAIILSDYIERGTGSKYHSGIHS